ncbi:MAG: hypothetical protein ACXW15_03005 [Acidimicrobiia bacterium]
MRAAILESARGRHRAPSRWEKLRPVLIGSPGQHRAIRSFDQPEDAPPAPRPISAARPARPAPRLTQPPARPARPARPVRPNPAPASNFAPSESVSRSGYSSSMLQMLGLDEEIVFEPTVTTMTSPQPQWQPPAPVAVAERVGLDRLPALSDMRMVNDSHADTGTLIERLWFATEEHEAVQPAADLAATDFGTVPERTFRWTIIIAGVLGLAVTVALLSIVAHLPARLAEQATASYRSAIVEAQDVLPTATEVMLTITDPTVKTEGLSEAAVTLARLDTASRNLFTYASEPLSSTPPLVSRNALDSLTPIRSDMANASQDGLAVERRLGDALTYRLVFDHAFALPDLPVTATPAEISAMGVELGLGLAGTLDAIAALPSDPAFESHRAEAEMLANRFTEWQVEYLSALRTGDVTTATRLVEELHTTVARVRTGIADPLLTVASWVSKEIEKLDTTLARLAGSLG